jgi:transcriptional regulator
MHPNPIFKNATTRQNIEFARQRGFGTLAINTSNHAESDGTDIPGPLLGHIPFVLDVTGEYLVAHLVRSNPILSLLDNETPGVLAVSGPDSYISPDWYQAQDQVPTWNYVAIHLRGMVKRLPDESLPKILDQLSSQFEQQLAPKPEWHKDKMDQQAFARMIKIIVPISMQVKAIDGTWKLSQNKSVHARQNAAEEVSTNGIGSESGQLADLKSDPPC